MTEPRDSHDLRGLKVAVLGAISWPSPPPGYGPWEQIATLYAICSHGP